MRKALIAVFVLLATALVWAQGPHTDLKPSDNPDVQTAPVITFTQNWPQALPPFYSIAVTSAGDAAYQSTPQADNKGDPYIVKFVMSEQNRTKLFDLAKDLDYFKGDFAYNKGRLAFTGTKTITFKNGGEQNRTSFVWSTNPEMQEVAKLFQGISETIERGRTLGEKYRYDKLGVDAELKSMESAAKDGRLEEIQAIQPLLAKIAKDSSMMNITRRRAEYLLSKIAPGQSANAGQH